MFILLYIGDDPTFSSVTRDEQTKCTLRWSVTDEMIDGIDVHICIYLNIIGIIIIFVD